MRFERKLCGLLAALALTVAAPAVAAPREPQAIALSPDAFLSARKTEQRGGTGVLTVVPVTHPKFTRAAHIKTVVNSISWWGVETRQNLSAPLKKGQAGLLRFWARCTETADETGQGLIKFGVQRNAGERTKAVELEVGVDAAWKLFEFPFVAVEDLPVGSGEVTFGTGNRRQTMEIAGVEVTTYPSNVALADLPRTEFTYEGREPGAQWRKDAEARIQKLRRADLAITVRDVAGRPVSGATVKVAMTRHAFHFGSSVAMVALTGTDADSEKYRAKILELYNSVSTENETKWPGWIGEWDWTTKREKTMEGLRWFKQHDLYVRGHVLVWPGWKNLPDAITKLRGTPQQGEIPARTLSHIADITSQTAGLIDEWDVINEPYLNNDLMNLFGRDIMADWFKKAREVLPHSPLYLNEAAGHDYVNRPIFMQNAIDVTRFVRSKGGEVDGLGIQSHMSNLPSPPARILRTFDKYVEALGSDLKIRATEFDMDTDNEQLQADFTRDYLIVLFSHPNVVGYQSWGFWSKFHWRPRGAFYRDDWSERPALAEYKKLVFGRWWTNATGASNARGEWRGPVFQGRYDVTVTKGGRTVTQTLDIPLGLTRAGLDIVLPGGTN
jgi:endo-1,4-beta-xylanase